MNGLVATKYLTNSLYLMATEYLDADLTLEDTFMCQHVNLTDADLEVLKQDLRDDVEQPL